MPNPFNNWYHCTGSTYGAWLRGDPRGWRDRKNKIPVPYDYKNPPPPGAYTRLHNHCLKLMKRNAVVFTRTELALACKRFAEALTFHHVECIDLCITPTHFHALCRFVPPPNKSPGIAIPGQFSNPTPSKIRTPRHLIGIAKKQSALAIYRTTRRPKGGIWAVRGKNKPIRCRLHQLRVARYIRAHAKRDAIVWSLHKNHLTNL